MSIATIRQRLRRLLQNGRAGAPIPAVDEKARTAGPAPNTGLFPPGHFYSPIPDFEAIQKEAAAIWGPVPRRIDGIDLNEEEQLRLLAEFEHYYAELPFPVDKQPGLRYYYENPAYSYSDAIILYCMIRHSRPRRFIEVGSGFSSCVSLDTSDMFLQSSIEFTFIEPYPELLYSLIGKNDHQKVRVVPARLQDVPLANFEALQSGDILFIDSTHVSKINSDVNRVFFSILPCLSSGVYIHFHDVFYPFEYPKEWILEGRAWNEDYILRAFLQYNEGFQIVFFNTFLEMFHEEQFRARMPLCLRNRGGSLWLRKL